MSCGYLVSNISRFQLLHQVIISFTSSSSMMATMFSIVSLGSAAFAYVPPAGLLSSDSIRSGVVVKYCGNCLFASRAERSPLRVQRALRSAQSR